jgi:hypothetical protein
VTEVWKHCFCWSRGPKKVEGAKTLKARIHKSSLLSAAYFWSSLRPIAAYQARPTAKHLHPGAIAPF